MEKVNPMVTLKTSRSMRSGYNTSMKSIDRTHTSGNGEKFVLSIADEAIGKNIPNENIGKAYAKET